MAKVFGSIISPYVRKLLIFLKEKDVTYENIALPPHNDHPDFQALSPLGKIPAYQDDQVAGADSTAICCYLEKRYPKPQLIPEQGQALVDCLWFNEYAVNPFMTGLAKPYVHLLVNPKIFKIDADKAVAEEGLETDIPACFEFLESKLTKDYLAGDDYSLADIVIIAFMQCYLVLGYTVDEKRYPKLAAYVDRLLARPAVGAAHAELKKAVAHFTCEQA